MTELLVDDVITAERAIELLEQQVALKGADYVYPGSFTHDCVNVEYDDATERWAPSCIVGYALCAAGATPQQFVDLMLTASGVEDLPPFVNFGGPEYPTNEDPNEVWDEWEDPLGYRVLRVAQTLQDKGFTWGVALEGAKRVAAGEPEEFVIENIERR